MRGRLKSQNREKTCQLCKKNGHIRVDCYKLKNLRMTTNKEKGKQPEKIGVSGDWLSEVKILVISDDGSNPCVDWVLDLACTFHMCPSRIRLLHMKWFQVVL